MKIDKRTKMACWCCKKSASLDVWDDSTLKEANCIEAIRDYVSLTDPRAYTIEEDTVYKCPNCGAWVEGAKIVELGCIDLDEYNS